MMRLSWIGALLAGLLVVKDVISSGKLKLFVSVIYRSKGIFFLFYFIFLRQEFASR